MSKSLSKNLQNYIRLRDEGIRANLVLACQACNLDKTSHRRIANYIEKGFKYLASKGEDLSWADSFGRGPRNDEDWG